VNRYTGPLFVLPALLVLAVLTVYPIAYTGVLTVTNEQGQFVGGDNLRAVAAARVTGVAVWNTVYFVGGSIVLQVALGTLVGILLNQPFRGRAAVRAAILIPWIVPGIVAATTWAWMLHSEFGIVSYMLQAAGIIDGPVGWLTSGDTVMAALVAVNVWKLFPFVAVMVLAGLQTVPHELYESARVDGATFWGEVRHVMLPHLKPVLVSVTLLLTIWGLNGITIIYTMTRGGPANRSLTVPIQIFRQAFESFQFHEAAALSTLFFLATLVLVVVYVRLATSRDGQV